MTKPLSIADRQQLDETARKLPERVHDPVCRVDPATGDVVVENGKARIVLQSDGTIRLEGVRLVAMVEERIDMNAAIIRLN